MSKILIITTTFLLLLESPELTHGQCENPPTGHLCRSMDLTGFCLQTSHIIPIRNAEISPSYSHMNKIFETLESRVQGNLPFVHFGAYHAQIPPLAPGATPYPGRHQGGTYSMEACLVTKGCLTEHEMQAQRDRTPGLGNPPAVTDAIKYQCTCPPNAKAADAWPLPAGYRIADYIEHWCGCACTEPTTNGAVNPPDPPPALICGGTGRPADEQRGTYEDGTPPTGIQCHENCRCCLRSPPTEIATRTIFSFQDACELKYLKSKVTLVTPATDLMTIQPGGTAQENPYHLEVSEITVDGSRLHNWLHIKIYHNATGNVFRTPTGDFGTGRIKMAFIMVGDALGYPVGEFVNTIPCEKSCKCEEQNTAAGANGPVCHQGKREDAFPCMYEGMRVISNTGMMMVQLEDDTAGRGYQEIHATWRYAQSRSPEQFHTELHFHALLVDDYTECIMHSKAVDADAAAGNPGLLRIGAISERIGTRGPPAQAGQPGPLTEYVKRGIFGWNPIYTILHPTNETIGSYDYFREDVFEDHQINCHVPISPHHYIVEPYPDSGPLIKVVPVVNPHQDHCYRLDNILAPNPSETAAICHPPGQDPKRTPTVCTQRRSRTRPFHHDTYGFVVDGKKDPAQVYPWTLHGARSAAYASRDDGVGKTNWFEYKSQDLRIVSDTVKVNKKLYFSAEATEETLPYRECDEKPVYWGTSFKHTYPNKADKYVAKYGHFCAAVGEGKRVPNLPGGVDDWPNYLAVLWQAPAIDGKSYYEDRCFCPTIPGTPDPRFKEPPGVQVQGRRQHAYQMIIAWNCIVPFSIFVSRYYKETYSKVFFLQEFWWYTTHVMCMVSAAMFTFGGIYVMELKRRDPINWLDPNITAHIAVGCVNIAMFFFQVISGFFRVKDVKKRVFNIFMHWLFGVLEYFMAVACMINSSFILMSGMTCAGVIALGFLLVFQVLFYASMEVHMRAVDKQMKLNPPRSYLPPPVMRVFHKDAPDSKFRIYVLLAYLTLCVGSAIIQFSAMESNKEGESCFIKSSKYQERLDWAQQNG